MNIIKTITDRYYRNAEMVSYWKTQDAVEAKVMRQPEGHYAMQMKGEKYLFPGFPRGSLLYGPLSPLKHLIKNKIFNATWQLLEEKKPDAEVRSYLTGAWRYIIDAFRNGKPADEDSASMRPGIYDVVPFENLVPPVKELHRALTAVGFDPTLRDIICFIFQEDDSYRMRFQWCAKFFSRWWKPLPEDFDYALGQLEHAETVSDMKERERLFRRVFMCMVKDSPMFNAFLKEMDWNKVRLTAADKYFFRAKYFKCDYPEYEY